MKQRLRSILEMLYLVRWRPFSTDTDQGRTDERHRKLILSVLASGAAKGTGLLVMLASVPLTFEYLGPERYGLWVTLLGVMAMMNFADLGISAGLINFIAEAHGKDDRTLAKHASTTALSILISSSLFFGTLFAVSFQYVNWIELFNIESAIAVKEIRPSILALAVCFLLNLPFGAVNRVYIGYQESFVNSLWGILGNILGLTTLWFAVRTGAGLPILVLCIAGGPLVSNFLSACMLFGLKRSFLRPRWSHIDLAMGKKLIRRGALFFVLQLAAAFSISADPVIATRLLGPEVVPEYSLVMRLFGIAPLFMELVFVPLWPAYSEAHAKGDNTWIKRTLSGTIIFSLLFTTAISTVCAVFSEQILVWWSGGQFAPSTLFLAGAAVWAGLSVCGSAVASFLNGTGAIRFQATCAIVMALAALGAKLFLVPRLGIAGLVWATIAAYVAFVAVPMSIYVPRMLRRYTPT